MTSTVAGVAVVPELGVMYSANPLHTACARVRSSLWCRGGSRNRAAGTLNARAIVQPSNRSPNGPSGDATGTTKSSSADRCPAEKLEPRIAANDTITPTTSIDRVASHPGRPSSVAKLMKA